MRQPVRAVARPGLDQAAAAHAVSTSARPGARSRAGETCMVIASEVTHSSVPRARWSRISSSYSSSQTLSAPTSTCTAEQSEQGPGVAPRHPAPQRDDHERDHEQRREVHEGPVGEVDVHELARGRTA